MTRPFASWSAMITTTVNQTTNGGLDMIFMGRRRLVSAASLNRELEKYAQAQETAAVNPIALNLAVSKGNGSSKVAL
jgi:hypothetical protein